MVQEWEEVNEGNREKERMTTKVEKQVHKNAVKRDEERPENQSSRRIIPFFKDSKNLTLNLMLSFHCLPLNVCL